MTHEELLAKMAQIAHTKDANEARNDYLLALSAVVKLHSPCTGDDHDDSPALVGVPCICVSCDGLEYPCPTIQVIEKELG